MAIMNVLAELHQEHDLKVTNPKITFAKKITAETKLIKSLTSLKPLSAAQPQV